MVEAREIKDGLAQRLAGNGAAVDASPAQTRLPVNDGNSLIHLGGLDGRLLPCGP